MHITRKCLTEADCWMCAWTHIMMTIYVTLKWGWVTQEGIPPAWRVDDITTIFKSSFHKCAHIFTYWLRELMKKILESNKRLSALPYQNPKYGFISGLLTNLGDSKSAWCSFRTLGTEALCSGSSIMHEAARCQLNKLLAFHLLFLTLSDYPFLLPCRRQLMPSRCEIQSTFSAPLSPNFK